MKYFKSMIFCLLIVTAIFAQFKDITVKIDALNLKPQEKNDLQILPGQIQSYIEDHEWFSNKHNIALPVNINIYVQKAQINGAERKFSGQFIINTQSNDTQLFEKKMSFNYSQNEALIHSPDIKSLASILDFYAYVMLGSEVDTYDPLGGATLFEKARNIGTRAQMSNYSSGWTQRLENLDEIVELRYFRKYKYYYWTIIDLETNGNMKEFPETIDKALFNLEEEIKINNRSRYMHLFLDAHAPDLADLLKLYGSKEQKNKILELDTDNTKIYKKAFKR